MARMYGVSVREQIGLRGRAPELARVFRSVGVLPVLLVLLIVTFGILQPRFLTVSNLLIVGRQATYLVIVTVAQMLPLLCAGFDLSVGSSIALTSIVTANTLLIMQSSINAPLVAVALAFLVGVVVATLVGVVNGAVISIFRVSPFVVTLAMMSAARGVGYILSGGVPVFGLPAVFNDYLGVGHIGGIPVPVVAAAVVVLVMYVVLNWTRMGRYFYAVGGNAEAARLSGIATGKYLFLAYALCGTLTGIAGVLLTARVDSGEPNLAGSMPLESIAAAVVGGVSLRGGEGRLHGAVLGAVFIVLLQNGMDLANIGSYTQMVVMGFLLILAVVVDRYLHQ